MDQQTDGQSLLKSCVSATKNRSKNILCPFFHIHSSLSYWSNLVIKRHKPEIMPELSKICAFWAKNARVGPLLLKKVVMIPSDYPHWIPKPHFSRFKRENNVCFPLENWKSEKNGQNADSGAHMLDQVQGRCGIPSDFAMFDLRIGFYGSKTLGYVSCYCPF